LYVTCVVPSLREVVPSSDADAPLAAFGEPVVVRGGQACAHAPEQVDCVLVSASKRYRVFPFAPTRIWPRLLLATEMVAGTDCELGAVPPP
jgi:hypothetical protein